MGKGGSGPGLHSTVVGGKGPIAEAAEGRMSARKPETIRQKRSVAGREVRYTQVGRTTKAIQIGDRKMCRGTSMPIGARRVSSPRKGEGEKELPGSRNGGPRGSAGAFDLDPAENEPQNQPKQSRGTAGQGARRGKVAFAAEV